MSAAITLADAITALVAEKRAVGYKYDAEARVLARFEAFCRSEFPGLGTLTQASVEAWIAAARRRGVTPGDPAGPGRAGPGVGPLAGPPGRAGLRPAHGRAAQARPLRPAHLHRPANWRPCSPRPTAATTARRSRSGTWSCRCCSARSTPAACAPREARLLRVGDVDLDAGVLQIRDAKGGKDRQVPVCEPLRVRLADYHAQVAGQLGPGTGSSPARPGSR